MKNEVKSTTEEKTIRGFDATCLIEFSQSVSNHISFITNDLRTVNKLVNGSDYVDDHLNDIDTALVMLNDYLEQIDGLLNDKEKLNEKDN